MLQVELERLLAAGVEQGSALLLAEHCFGACAARWGPCCGRVLIPKGCVFMSMLFEIWLSAQIELSWSLTPVPFPPSGMSICAGCHARYKQEALVHKHNGNFQTHLLHCLHGRASSAGRSKHSPEQNQAAA